MVIDVMKRIVVFFAMLLTVAACEHDIVRDTDFVVSFDSSNSYVAGEPVRFLFDGEVDNIVFYSGEPGSVYGEEGASGNVIKNIQNYLHEYEYVWNVPGTYELVFLGTNVTYMSESMQAFTLSVTIIENL